MISYPDLHSKFQEYLLEFGPTFNFWSVKHDRENVYKKMNAALKSGKPLRDSDFKLPSNPDITI